ncbi:hypothetical protein, partial [Klebsiella pneumoniae]|uniref:hypothetical protein n=1 Tax=Klebsiella pneumoniae TaxID=573 RepID=UPI00195BD9C3
DDRNRSRWSTSKTPSYTKSVSWHHYLDIEEITPFRYRWCFANPVEALYLFDTATEFYEIPKKRSSLKGHRYRVAPLLVENDELGFPKW